eukprot:TRINITY_DN56864_c0_g3_i1.p1 TRINITY_DN56864_c0_g3~~TRINITY_DN56864_c0_g3_i1.p1  ORF type:complete len:308 (-),score=17.37 TRINITY_DN56864_c0_g3_i1:119-952(-)
MQTNAMEHLTNPTMGSPKSPKKREPQNGKPYMVYKLGTFVYRKQVQYALLFSPQTDLPLPQYNPVTDSTIVDLENKTWSCLSSGSRMKDIRPMKYFGSIGTFNALRRYDQIVFAFEVPQEHKCWYPKNLNFGNIEPLAPTSSPSRARGRGRGRGRGYGLRRGGNQRMRYVSPPRKRTFSPPRHRPSQPWYPPPPQQPYIPPPSIVSAPPAHTYNYGYTWNDEPGELLTWEDDTVCDRNSLFGVHELPPVPDTPYPGVWQGYLPPYIGPNQQWVVPGS